MDDKRQERRSRIRKSGRILYNDKSTLDCVIRDASPKGARLEFSHSAFLPETFVLQVGTGDLVKGQVPCALRWTLPKSAGVELLEPFDLVPKWQSGSAT